MQPPQPSRVRSTVAALIAAVDAVKDADTVLLDGPTVGEVGQSDGIAIAVTDGTTPAVFVRRSREPGWGQSYREDMVIVCSVWSWSGDTDLDPRWDRCQALMTLMQEVVAANRTLDGNCDQLNLDDDQDWLPAQTTTAGGSVAVGFTITATTTGA